MDGDSEDLELLLASIRQEVGALREDRRMAAVQGSRGAALREHVLDLLGAVEYRISRGPDSSAPASTRRAFARSLRQSMVMLRGAHAALPWLAATREPAVNLGSLYLTEELAAALVGPDVDLVVVPNAEAMYSTASRPFSPVIDGTSGYTPTATRRPIVLNYPLTDGDRLLLHPLFAHEIGHASVDQHGLVSSVESLLRADRSFEEGRQEAVATMTGLWSSNEATVERTVDAMLRAWIEELLCDHLATEAMGISFLLAFACFVTPLSYGEPGSEHPPATLRVQLMLEHLDRRGWMPYLERVAPGVKTWLERLGNDASLPFITPLAPVFDFFRDQLTAHAPALQDTAHDRLGAQSLDPAASVSDADEAAMLLDSWILPVGLSGPLHPRSIVIGGWQAALRRHGDGPAGVVSSVADDRLQDLVGKALEMSVVVSSWPSAA